MKKDRWVEMDTYNGTGKIIPRPPANPNQQKPKERWVMLGELRDVRLSQGQPNREAWRKGFNQKVPTDTGHSWKAYVLDPDFISKH